MSAPGVSASRSAAVSPVFHARMNRSTVLRIIDLSHGGSTVALVREAAGVVAGGAVDVAAVQPASIIRATKEAKEVRITTMLLLRGARSRLPSGFHVLTRDRGSGHDAPRALGREVRKPSWEQAKNPQSEGTASAVMPRAGAPFAQRSCRRTSTRAQTRSVCLELATNEPPSEYAYFEIVEKRGGGWHPTSSHN
jgi:hypothetical protein